MSKVYVGMVADLLHAGHIKILQKAAALGEVTVGLFTDKAAGEVNDLPYLDFESRKLALESIKCVDTVIEQNTASYASNLHQLKPDYVVHGDDWQYNYLHKPYREEVIKLLDQWGGELIELPYDNKINDLQIKDRMSGLGIGPARRLARLRRLIASKPCVQMLEVHSALCGLIAEKITNTTPDGKLASFDGMWSSSLTDSTAKGKPDIEAVDTTSRLTTINEIFEVTNKPLIYDADTGGKPEHFMFTVRNLERVGVSAAIIEDKTGLKKNSLFGNEVEQTQDTIENFCQKISMAKDAQIDKDFMIIARIESLILDAGMGDALARATAYTDAGADGIMIHSRKKEPDEIFEFIDIFRKKDQKTPIVVVPTSFDTVRADEFGKRGVNVIIYANHMLRAAYPAMVNVAKSILLNQRSHEADKLCMSIKEILELIPGTK